MPFELTTEAEDPTEHVELRGTDFAYSDSGSGPVMFSAHGLSWSRRNNRTMGFSDFHEVAESGHRLISYDARGHGETPGTRSEDNCTWAALAS